MFCCTSTRPAAAQAASPEAPSTNLWSPTWAHVPVLLPSLPQSLVPEEHTPWALQGFCCYNHFSLALRKSPDWLWSSTWAWNKVVARRRAWWSCAHSGYMRSLFLEVLLWSRVLPQQESCVHPGSCPEPQTWLRRWNEQEKPFLTFKCISDVQR